MNCPLCGFKFAKMMAASMESKAIDLRGAVAPVLCESCLGVSLLYEGRLLKLTDEELEAVKDSPAYKDIVEPLRRRLLAQRKAQSN